MEVINEISMTCVLTRGRVLCVRNIDMSGSVRSWVQVESRVGFGQTRGPFESTPCAGCGRLGMGLNIVYYNLLANLEVSRRAQLYFPCP